jgi:hypothetical protein
VVLINLDLKVKKIKPINTLKSSAMQLVQLKSYVAINHNFSVHYYQQLDNNRFNNIILGKDLNKEK